MPDSESPSLPDGIAVCPSIETPYGFEFQGFLKKINLAVQRLRQPTPARHLAVDSAFCSYVLDFT
jgi:hypothetical protein